MAGLPKKDVCLGIDIGSHRTRLCLWGNDIDIVIEPQTNPSHGDTFYPGDFPSSLYIFDDPKQEVYLLTGDDLSRRSVSAKYAFYVLADAEDTLLQQYPAVHSLTERKNDPAFRAQLRRGLLALLSAIRGRALAACHLKNLGITKIGLTIPVQWGLDFEKVYRELVTEVFHVDESTTPKIFFFTETESLSRYLFKHHEDLLDGAKEYNSIMFCDFGGHNMNGCLFSIARDEDSSRNGFFRLGKAFGAGGGSEQWEFHIAHWFTNFYENSAKSQVTPEHLEEVLTRFRRQKGLKTENRREISLLLPVKNRQEPLNVNLSLEIMQESWEKGMVYPLQCVQEQLDRLAQMASLGHLSKPLVVVSGGTSRNPAVKSRLEALCAQRNLPVKFTQDLGIAIAYGSAAVAKSAAYVVSQPLTVQDFVARGAAIGIQMRQAPRKGQEPTTVPWDDSAKLLLYKNQSYSVTISTKSLDNFQLICDPFYRPEMGEVQAKTSYDLVTLGPRQQGHWGFRLSLVGAGDQMYLHLSQRYKRVLRNQWNEAQELRLPLYFDGGSFSIHVGTRDRDISELNLGLPQQPHAEDFDNAGLRIRDCSQSQERRAKPRGTLRGLPRVDPYKITRATRAGKK